MKKPVIDRNRPLGLYLHIPFCKAKCAYCDFYSLPHSEEKMDAYAAALARHITEVAPQMQNHRVDTVYFGGGTPSYLGVSRLTRLLQTVLRRYDVARGAEITLEANPDSACDVKALRALRRAGFNRISLGVQSADDGLLRAIGRIHTFAQVQEAVAAVRKAGFKNLSMDLIYGLPGQTMQQWEDTLAAVTPSTSTELFVSICSASTFAAAPPMESVCDVASISTFTSLSPSTLSVTVTFPPPNPSAVALAVLTSASAVAQAIVSTIHRLSSSAVSFFMMKNPFPF